MKRLSLTALAFLSCLTQVRCASVGNVLAINSKPTSTRIASPFTNYHPGSEVAQNMILRTKTGDRTVELEIPGNADTMGEFSMPFSPNMQTNARGPASIKDGAYDPTGMVDDSYKNRAPSYSDREILRTRPQGQPADELKRHEIEESLSLAPTEDSTPEASSSYLGGVDHIKQLYRLARYEVALIETDEMIRQYPTDAPLYEMRGTLLDRLGKRDLALQAWNQSLRFDAKNAGLRRFIERKRNTNIATGGS